MSQQNPTAHEDDWWRKLYEGAAPDTGPAAAPDSLDDRFDSAADAVGSPTAPGEADGPPGTAAYEADPYVDGAGPDPDEDDADTDAEADPRTGLRTAAPPTAAPVSGHDDEDALPADHGHEDALPADQGHEDTVITDARHGVVTPGPRPPAARTPAPGPPPLAPRPPAPETRLPEPPVPPHPTSPPPMPPHPVPEPPASGPPQPQPQPHPASVPPQSAPPPSGPRPARPPGVVRFAAPWESPAGPQEPRTFAVPVPQPPEPSPPEPGTGRHARGPASQDTDDPLGRRPTPAGHLGDRSPAYEAEPATLPAATALNLDGLVPDTVLDGARYGTYTLRTASVRGDAARFRGEPRSDALLTARFGSGEGALVLVALARGVRAAEGAHLTAADACRWIGGAVGRSHARLSEDIRAGRRGDLKSGLQRLTDRTYGRLRSRSAELGPDAREHAVGLRCLLLSADPRCRTRVFFGVGAGGLFRLRDGVWQDLEPALPEGGATTGEPVVGYGSPPREPYATGGPGAGDPGTGDPGTGGSGRADDRLTLDLQIVTPAGPYVEDPLPPPSEPFRFRASVARSGDTLLLCSPGFADPMRGEPALAGELAARWSSARPPGLAEFLADLQPQIEGYAEDRTAAAVWEA
ncbi:protein phosphatase 2C domain-containing protein [Streptomyces sp. AM 2-1-1]|uniref:protein phosphatase 2C domain-containing protein n=1 Tax=Streptomyces sp. AM 2-1-1 TaxID=3028709 RepID=UPI0023B9E612|nr:protein phosphatase 2C domain-containing protein [Streptomyces sp. AM 2-1-1]WEH38903.1 protein phosphatase 2C domain-containing protein [Streptomyces sp. AM 2-1-1]